MKLRVDYVFTINERDFPILKHYLKKEFLSLNEIVHLHEEWGRKGVEDMIKKAKEQAKEKQQELYENYIYDEDTKWI